MPRETAGGGAGTVESASVDSVTAWQQIMGRRPVEFRHSLEPGVARFSARHQTARAGEATVTRMQATAHRVRRAEPAPEGRFGGSFLQIGLQVSGRSVSTSADRVAVTCPGDIVVFNTDHAFSVRFSQLFGCVLFLLPQAELGLPSTSINGLSVTRVPGDRGVGLLMARMLAAFDDDIGLLTGRGSAGVVSSAISLAGSLLLEAQESDDGRHPAVTTEIAEYIDENLDDPALSGRQISRDLHMSLRSLQYHLADRGTTASRLIKDRRLDRARRLLSDPRDPRDIRLIAEECGFVSAAHFSREFKRRFDETPTGMRRRVR